MKVSKRGFLSITWFLREQCMEIYKSLRKLNPLCPKYDPAEPKCPSDDQYIELQSAVVLSNITPCCSVSEFSGGRRGQTLEAREEKN